MDGMTDLDDIPWALDLGDGHKLRWVQWAPDRALNPQYDGVPSVDKFGAIIGHTAATGRPCSGFVTFDEAVARRVDPQAAKWTVESWEPLTITPSILCGLCGDHGWVREGRWVRA